jgi:hypothetical protein
MARNFKALQAKMDIEIRARSEARAREIMGEMRLHELRAARELTQENLAAVLSRFIEAMGGHLEIGACFPDGSVHITQFAKETRDA